MIQKVSHMPDCRILAPVSTLSARRPFDEAMKKARNHWPFTVNDPHTAYTAALPSAEGRFGEAGQASSFVT